MTAALLTFPRRRSRLVHAVGRVAVHRRTPSAGSVLEYIERIEKYAARVHNRAEEQRYGELWRFVFEVTHGTLPRHPAAPVCRAQAALPPEPAPVPGWKRQMLAKPMREVVSVDTVRVKGGAFGHGIDVIVMELSCGHKLEEQAVMWDGKTAHRRRCRECARSNHVR